MAPHPRFAGDGRTGPDADGRGGRFPFAPGDAAPEQSEPLGDPTAPRLLLVGPLPPPAGGMANQARLLRERWLGSGARVAFVQTNAPYRPRWVAGFRGVRALFRLVPYLRALWRASARSDVLHLLANSGWSWFLFALPAVVIARVRGLAVVVNYRGGGADRFLAGAGRLAVPVLRRVDALVVPSAYLQQVFHERGIGSRIVPNVVDVGRFRWRAPKAVVPPRPRLLVARNLEPIYGVDTAIRAFRDVLGVHPQAELVVAGSGPERDALGRLATRLGVAARVRFTGRLDADAMAEQYASADLLLNASRVDNMPNALLEALASGVPVVSTDAGGIPAMVSDGDTAVLVAVDDVDGLANAALRVLGTPSLALELAVNGRRLVERYSWEVVSRAWLAVYSETGRLGR